MGDERETPRAGEHWLVSLVSDGGAAECRLRELSGRQWWQVVHGAPGYGDLDWRSATPIRRIPTAEELAELKRERDEALKRVAELEAKRSHLRSVMREHAERTSDSTTRALLHAALDMERKLTFSGETDHD